MQLGSLLKFCLQVLNTTIGQIRFLSMTPDEFASSPALSGILTESECLAILMNMSSRDKWPMPSQLSTSRQQRRFDSRGSGNPVQR